VTLPTAILLRADEVIELTAMVSSLLRGSDGSLRLCAGSLGIKAVLRDRAMAVPQCEGGLLQLRETYEGEIAPNEF
jgi:hypothetical protein